MIIKCNLSLKRNLRNMLFSRHVSVFIGLIRKPLFCECTMYKCTGTTNKMNVMVNRSTHFITWQLYFKVLKEVFCFVTFWLVYLFTYLLLLQNFGPRKIKEILKEMELLMLISFHFTQNILICLFFHMYLIWWQRLSHFSTNKNRYH